MNNSNAKAMIEDCLYEIKEIEKEIKKVGQFSIVTSFLTNYALIKACGTIEVCYKSLIADNCIIGQHARVIKFIDRKFRRNSSNPSVENIERSLKDFDEIWHRCFVNEVIKNKKYSKFKASLKSLKESRNAFAHGGTCTTTFKDIKRYFAHSWIILKAVDAIIIRHP